VGRCASALRWSMWAAIGILAALQQRAMTGRGAIVDTSLFETSVAWTLIQLAGHLATGEIRKPMGSGIAEIVPHQAFRTRDGYIMVAAGNDNLFRSLCAAVGHPAWASDARFASNDGRVRNRDVLIPLLEGQFLTADRVEWARRLDTAGVPNAPIQTLDQVATHPQTRALGLLQQAPDSDVTLLGLPLSFDGVRPPYRRSAPRYGEHTDEVLGASADKTT
jgi:crotonobetainyl-CoA:carnitine CoA-transferase CaiB-like acyl-CoA transferase